MLRFLKIEVFLDINSDLVCTFEIFLNLKIFPILIFIIKKNNQKIKGKRNF